MELNFVKTRDNGDATSEYNVLFTEVFTVEQFLHEYLLKQNEWGYVSVDKPYYVSDDSIILEYQDDIAFNINTNLLEKVRHKIVTKIEASGGWSRMDYTLFTKEIKEK